MGKTGARKVMFHACAVITWFPFLRVHSVCRKSENSAFLPQWLRATHSVNFPFHPRFTILEDVGTEKGSSWVPQVIKLCSYHVTAVTIPNGKVWKGCTASNILESILWQTWSRIYMSKKANHILDFMRWHFKLCSRQLKETYFYFVRPILEYTCTVWDPHTQLLTNKIEKAQSSCARFLLNNYGIKESATAMSRQKNLCLKFSLPFTTIK